MTNKFTMPEEVNHIRSDVSELTRKTTIGVVSAVDEIVVAEIGEDHIAAIQLYTRLINAFAAKAAYRLEMVSQQEVNRDNALEAGVCILEYATNILKRRIEKYAKEAKKTKEGETLQ